MRQQSNLFCLLISVILILLFSLIFSACHDGHGLSPTGEDAAGSSGISGTVTFTGEWPDSTFQVNVIASRNYPQDIIDLNSLIDFVNREFVAGNIVLSKPVPSFVTQSEYTLNLEPNKYEWILVAWFPQITNFYNGVKVLGSYINEPDTLPTTLYIRPGEIVRNINIRADFANIEKDLPF